MYRDPSRFFSLTYPTHNLRDLVRNVSLRLAGKGMKAVHQINVTFGGGKTHALITLYHLANDPTNLAQVDAVDEFRQHAGTDFARARVVLLPFDKIDIARGLDTRSPSGETRRWLQPWTILAYQLAGEDGVAQPSPQWRTRRERYTACGTDHHRPAPPRDRRGRRGARVD